MKFSIGIPVYKAKFFHTCIESVLAQTYRDFELIILNDSSPEDIDGIVNSFQDTRICYHKNDTNVGAVDIVKNWNKLVELAQGDYFMCMGDDDMLAPNCLEEYIRLINSYPECNVYHARTLMVDSAGEVCDIQQDRPDRETVLATLWEATFHSRLQFVGDFLYRTTALRAAGGYYYLPLAWESDYITPYMVAGENGIVNGHKPTFVYRQNPLSITSSASTIAKMDATQQYINWLDAFLKCVHEAGPEDKYYKKLLLTKNPRRYKDKIFMIAHDTHGSLTKIFYWWKNRQKYDMKGKDIVKAYFLSVILFFHSSKS